MDYVAGVLELTALFLIGRKNRWGFVFHFAACAVWIYVAFDKPVYGLLIIMCPALLLNVWNFRKWSAP
jgi:hypothetical protein